MEATKKTFIGRLNTDDSEMLLPPGDYVSASNIRIITPEGGETGRVVSVEGNSLVQASAVVVASGSVCIGAIEDAANRRLIWFASGTNTTRNAIYLYENDSDTVTELIRDADVVGGLGWTTSTLIHSIALVGDILYWTDNTAPRRLNIAAAAGTGSYSYPVSGEVTADYIELIRRPPAYTPWTEKKTDGAYTNDFTANESFQFAFQYQYYDGEMSTLSSLSRGVRINRKDDTYNYIKVTLPVDEVIRTDVKAVRLIVKFGLSGKSFVAKEWDRSNSTDSTAITAHNAGSTLLSFDFYNDIVGEGIDDATAVKPFDSVPLLATALEVANNRLFLGNCTEGYDTPASTSLSVAREYIAVSGSLSRLLYEVRVVDTKDATTTYYTAWYVWLPHFDQDGWYEVPGTSATSTASQPPVASTPATGAFVNLVFKGHNLDQVAQNVKVVGGVVSLSTATVSANAYNITAIPASVGSGSVYCGYHSKSAYQFGVVFYDRSLRKSAVVTNSSTKVEVEDRDYGFSNITASYTCTLSNAAATTEIPDWAYYYQIVRTDNLKTRFWFQSYSPSALNFYATKDSYGDYVYTETTFSASVVGIGLNAGALTKSGIGYQYQEGDMCVIYTSGGNKYTVPVMDQSGDYIILNAEDIGTISGFNVIYEIYSPYTNSVAAEPYFEVGEMYAITDPTTSGREYSTTEFNVRGDMVYMQRRYTGATEYEAEAMSPNDKYWQRRMVDNGRPNIVSKLGQQQKKTGVSFSNTYLQGAATNGLSSFEALNEVVLPAEMGEIQRLVLTSKTQQDGSVMLAIGKSETVSMYLGESQLLDTEGSSFITKSSGVVGSMNTLRGSHGTLHPESVVEHNGQVWFWDTIKASPILYSSNGLFPVANNKMRNYYRKISGDYLSAYAGDTELSLLGNRNIALGGVDPFNGEFLLYTPNFYGQMQGDSVITDMTLGDGDTYSNIAIGTDVLLASVALGDLVKITFTYSGFQPTVTLKNDLGHTILSVTPNDGSAYYIRQRLTGNGNIYITNTQIVTVNIKSVIDVRHKMYDGQEATMVYSPANDGFVARMDIHPECFCTFRNRLVSFSNAFPYIHNTGDEDRALFFSVQRSAQIAFKHTEGGTTPKVYGAVVVEGASPDYVHVSTEKPNTQSTSIVAADFDDREGVYYADIKRDRLSPNTAGDYETKEYRGDKIVGNTALFSVIYLDASADPPFNTINNVTILYTPSRGHKI